jgi:predicted murein hydrolase (TIGR00659 family)
MITRFNDIWVYLTATPLLWLTLTLIAYQAAYWLYARCGFHPLLNPVAIAVALIACALMVSHTAYPTYFAGAQFIHFLLGPATVALAIPLHFQFERLRREWRVMLLALFCGSVTAAGSAVLLGWIFGASVVTLKSLAPKSVTTPIAMGIAEKIGGLPSLTAVLVMGTGITGAALGKYVLDALKIRDPAARGFAIGVAAHGIGTARAFQVSEETGAFAGLGMGLNGALTALLVPLALWLVSLF